MCVIDPTKKGVRCRQNWEELALSFTFSELQMLSFVVLFHFNCKLSEQNLKQHICMPQGRCACRENLFPMQSSMWKLLIASNTTHHVDTKRDGFLSDSALEWWQMIWDTFSLGMFAETGEAAHFPHPRSCSYCRWTHVVQNFMSVRPSQLKCQSVGKIPHIQLSWPRKFFWSSYAPSKLQKRIMKHPGEWI